MFNEKRSPADIAKNRKLQFEIEMLLFGSTGGTTAAFCDYVARYVICGKMR